MDPALGHQGQGSRARRPPRRSPIFFFGKLFLVFCLFYPNFPANKSLLEKNSEAALGIWNLHLMHYSEGFVVSTIGWIKERKERKGKSN